MPWNIQLPYQFYTVTQQVFVTCNHKNSLVRKYRYKQIGFNSFCQRKVENQNHYILGVLLNV